MWKKLAEFVKDVTSIDSSPNQMFRVEYIEIVGAEKRIGIEFPEEMKEVWRTVGYKFISQSLDGKLERDLGNLLLSPLQVADAYLSENVFNFYQEPGDGFPFCYARQSDFMILSTRADGTNFVRLYGDNERIAVAESIADFIDRLLIDPSFYQWVWDLKYEASKHLLE